MKNLREWRIFDIRWVEEDGGKFLVEECCDSNYGTLMSADELEDLGHEIIELARSKKGEALAPPSHSSPSVET